MQFNFFLSEVVLGRRKGVRRGAVQLRYFATTRAIRFDGRWQKVHQPVLHCKIIARQFGIGGHKVEARRSLGRDINHHTHSHKRISSSICPNHLQRLVRLAVEQWISSYKLPNLNTHLAWGRSEKVSVCVCVFGPPGTSVMALRFVESAMQFVASTVLGFLPPGNRS